MNYIRGLGGGCCDDCAVDDACKAKPVVTSTTFYPMSVGTPYSFGPFGTNSPTSWACGALPPGLTFNSGTGVISGTPTTIGTTDTIYSATNACGTGSGTLRFIIGCDVISSSYSVGESGITGADYFGCLDISTCGSSPVCFGTGTVVCGGASPDREPGCSATCAFTCYLFFQTDTATSGTAVFKFYVDGILQLDTGPIGGSGSNQFRYSLPLSDGVKDWCCTVTSMTAGISCIYNVSSFYV